MAIETIINFLIIAGTVLLICFIIFRVIVKRWRLGLRMAAGDESLLSDGSVSMKTITDAPPGSVIVPHTPATPLDDNL
ncbi:TPA: hypothetical protein HA325_00540 [Candidatus Thalassarchaeaceae archaeon]|jgi:hypothetical protein|nr:hypothetical protein [Euryarchaeota archaeon]DAC67619.1 MAG TPA: hypothetical protein D7I15_00550 [Candidatus Poseidoniales archaeon]HII43097.1 hypothetical protein [Candidatus Thalassarchaeaceae archaeon]|tara:strand:- start:3744 stop:3977 length:234 start_codon:yes stop_codon:yes gene_type:complete